MNKVTELKRKVTYARIEELEARLHDIREEWLRCRGWTMVNTAAAPRLWLKEFRLHRADEPQKHLCSMALAVTIERHLEAEETKEATRDNERK
jgi:hypothetical protein